MRIRLLAFAGLQDVLGARELPFEIPAGSTVTDVWELLAERNPALRAVPQPPAAVNEQYERENVKLSDGDELAFIPPVSGG
ncbi:MAG: MoaD/ThiS family protein [Acidobacteria bacterium]|nr:MoaD/ThiS family protein [Acidobacteriota bacterium]